MFSKYEYHRLVCCLKHWSNKKKLQHVLLNHCHCLSHDLVGGSQIERRVPRWLHRWWKNAHGPERDISPLVGGCCLKHMVVKCLISFQLDEKHVANHQPDFLLILDDFSLTLWWFQISKWINFRTRGRLLASHCWGPVRVVTVPKMLRKKNVILHPHLFFLRRLCERCREFKQTTHRRLPTRRFLWPQTKHRNQTHSAKNSVFAVCSAKSQAESSGRT